MKTDYAYFSNKNKFVITTYITKYMVDLTNQFLQCTLIVS